MAKRKAKKSYTKRRRRSRMGAIGKIDLMAPIAMIGGAVVGRFLVNKFLAKQSGMIKGAAQVGAGIGVQLFVKNPIAYNAGSGMVAAGGLTLIQSVAPNLAIGAESDGGEILFISGTEDISTVNGVDQIGADPMNDDINTVNGIDEDYDY